MLLILLYDGSCNPFVDTNKPDAPISKYFSTDVHTYIVRWMSKMCVLILNKILHFRAVPGKIQKYLTNKYRSTDEVTLPHIGIIWRSLATHK